MTPTPYAFVKANWHAEIVDQALAGFLQVIAADKVAVFDVPGAFELPLVARKLAQGGRYRAVVAAALIVYGGIYRHDFVAAAVVRGLLAAGLETGVPVLSVALAPHHFQDTAHHRAIFADHFVLKGREAGETAQRVAALHYRIG